MAETLTVDGGKVIPLDPGEQAFNAAMAAPPKGTTARPDYPAPPKRDPAAPHGRNPDGSPKAPFGYKADGTPRQVPAGPGKPPKDRGTPAPPAPAASAPAAGDVRVRRAEDATTTFELISAGMSLLAMLGSSRAVAQYTAAQAKNDEKRMNAAASMQDRCLVLQLDGATFAIHAESVGPSMAEMAESNKLVAAMVDRLALFNGVASVGIAVMPLVYQVVANHAPKETRDNMPPQLLSLGVLPPTLLLEKLQAQNAVKMAKAQAAILREKQAAEAELAALRDSNGQAG